MLTDVVISTKNNLSEKSFSLRFVIRSLLNQAADDLNIIIADNGSKDDTSSQLKRIFGDKINIIDTSHVTGNLSASRNLAARCGTATMIFFIDDDMIPKHKGSIGKCIEIAQDVDFVCGAIRFWAPLTWPKFIRHDDPINKVISTLEQISSEPVSIDRITGKNRMDNRSYIANFGIIRRPTFESVGGFDEEYTGWGYQDTDLMWRLCVSHASYDLFSRYGVEIFHLSHKVDKGSNYLVNLKRFRQKQKEDGRAFKTNHFFEVYENDGYSLFDELPEEYRE